MAGLRMFLALAQGLYYIITGLWPLLSRRSFERITGPKVDFWLVNMVGLLATTIGATLGLAGLRRSSTPEIRLLAISSAVSFAGIDVIYVLRGRISKAYLADALAETALILGWVVAWRRESR